MNVQFQKVKISFLALATCEGRGAETTLGFSFRGNEENHWLLEKRAKGQKRKSGGRPESMVPSCTLSREEKG